MENLLGQAASIRDAGVFFLATEENTVLRTCATRDIAAIVYRPVPDAPPSVLAIAWPQQSRSTATAALVRAAATVAETAGADAARGRSPGHGS